MRLGIDLYAYNPASTDGVATFSLGLVEGLCASAPAGSELVLLVSKKNEFFFDKFFDGRKIRRYCVQTNPLARYVNRVLWLLSWLTRQYRLRFWYEKWFRKALTREIEGVVDALITPTTVFNFYALRIPTILCIHDIQHEYHPENFTRHQLMLRWASYRLSCARATMIQVSSRYIRDCLLEKFTFLSSEVFLIAPEGVDTERFSTAVKNQVPSALPESGREHFVFYPAQIWKHKNHALLMHALALFRARQGFELTCVLTGHDYGYWAEIDKLRTELGLQSVFYLGRVEFSELLWLYRHCSAVLALGLHESSSLPVREGASFGKPLVCADISPNIEASEYLNINLFQKENSGSLMERLVAIHENGVDIRDAAEENMKKVLDLRWSVVACSYWRSLSGCCAGL